MKKIKVDGKPALFNEATGTIQYPDGSKVNIENLIRFNPYVEIKEA